MACYRMGWIERKLWHLWSRLILVATPWLLRLYSAQPGKVHPAQGHSTAAIALSSLASCCLTVCSWLDPSYSIFEWFILVREMGTEQPMVTMKGYLCEDISNIGGSLAGHSALCRQSQTLSGKGLDSWVSSIPHVLFFLCCGLNVLGKCSATELHLYPFLSVSSLLDLEEVLSPPLPTV